MTAPRKSPLRDKTLPALVISVLFILFLAVVDALQPAAESPQPAAEIKKSERRKSTLGLSENIVSRSRSRKAAPRPLTYEENEWERYHVGERQRKICHFLWTAAEKMRSADYDGDLTADDIKKVIALTDEALEELRSMPVKPDRISR